MDTTEAPQILEHATA
jgi:WD40 repeat protein